MDHYFFIAAEADINFIILREIVTYVYHSIDDWKHFLFGFFCFVWCVKFIKLQNADLLNQNLGLTLWGRGLINQNH